jgi:hypothetical protein
MFPNAQRNIARSSINTAVFMQSYRVATPI